MSKQKQFNGHKSYKTCESTLYCIGNFEENIHLSRIALAVLMFLSYLQTDEHFTFPNLKICILVIFKAALASQMSPFRPTSL